MYKEQLRAALLSRTAKRQAVSRAPYGWRLKAGQLVPVELEQDILRIVKLRRSEGRTLQQIANELEQLGYESRSGGRFTRMQISRIAKGRAPIATGDEGPKHKEEQLPLMLSTAAVKSKASRKPPLSTLLQNAECSSSPDEVCVVGVARGSHRRRSKSVVLPSQLLLFEG